jgi:hypothetical protein
MQINLLGIIIVEFDVTSRLLIIYSALVEYLRKLGGLLAYNGPVDQLFLDFSKVFRGQILYNILTEFRIPMGLLSLMKIK